MLADARGLLGVYCTPETALGKKALVLAAQRIAEGASLADLARACRVASERWAAGERHPSLKSLTYLWGPQMVSVLAAGSQRSRGRDAPTYRRGEEQQAWTDSLAEMPALPDESRLLGGIQPEQGGSTT